MRVTLLSLLFLSFGIAIWGQSHATSLYYQISKEEYLRFKEDSVVDPIALQDVVDRKTVSYPNNKLGYFIKVYPYQENLKMEFIANTTLSLVVLPHPEHLLVQVLNKAGKNITHPKISLQGKNFKYNKTLKAFQLKEWQPTDEQEIKVETAEEVAFFEVEIEYYDYYGLEEPTDKKWGSRIKYTVIKAWHFVRRLVQKKSNDSKQATYKGYIAFNQPKFRPDDTLKIKGYFLNHKGQLLTDSIDVQLLEGYTEKWSARLAPVETGSYVLSIPLAASLQLALDRKYTVAFKQDGQLIKQHDFVYEDYQLDEVNYSLKSDKDSYEHGAKIMLQLEGQYITGHRIADGEVEVLVYADPYQRYYSNHFFDNDVVIKDTLWRIRQALAPDEPTQIIIPTDRFPKAKIPLTIVANFQNSNGELQYRQIEIKLQQPTIETKKTAPKLPIQLSLDGPYVKAYTTTDTVLSSLPIERSMEYDYYKDDHIKEIQLPYQERVSGYATYLLRYL